MEEIKSLSMNTSLKNARIFDDDAWQEQNGEEIRRRIKVEPDTDADNTTKEAQTTNINMIKKEDIKTEFKEEYQKDNENNTNSEILKTPPLTYKIKPDPDGVEDDNIKPDPDRKVDAMFDESPYNKELFNSLRIKEETPVKTEGEDLSNGKKNTLKSAKRTVFKKYSPYKSNEHEVSEKRISAKSRLGPRVDDGDVPRFKKHRRQDIEDDPVVIARREKQIEYGKNTIGYDNYRQLVPKEARQLDDPQTPNKYKKYSRKGWDGLIRQWRIKLHKYDPPTDS